MRCIPPLFAYIYQVRILTLGLNHRTAPVEIRERLAFSENDQPSALTRLVRDYELSEAAILSTCNRSELYIAADGDSGLNEARRFLEDLELEVLEEAPRLVETAVPIGGDVKLGAVAGREYRRLAQLVVADQARKGRGLVVFGEGQAFANLHRRGAVVKSES